MPSSRRDFLRRTGLASAVLGTHAFPGLSPQERAAPIPGDRSSALMKTFGLKYPIFQAGMGIVSDPELTIAVSAAGALGALGQAGVGPANTAPRIARVKAATDRPFAINYLLRTEPTTLQAALDAGARIVQFSWGLPSLWQDCLRG